MQLPELGVNSATINCFKQYVSVALEPEIVYSYEIVIYYRAMLAQSAVMRQ